jgi:hypothetical protein
VQRLEREDFQNQQVECALNEVGWFTHRIANTARIATGFSRLPRGDYMPAFSR